MSRSRCSTHVQTDLVSQPRGVGPGVGTEEEVTMTVSAGGSHSDVDRCPGAEELRRLRLAIRASGEIMFMTDPEGIFTHVNPEFTRVYGYEPSQVVGRTTPRILKSGTTSHDDYDAFWRLLRQRQVVRREFLNKAKDGDRKSVV